jgi:hypothetical protein
MRFIVGMPFNGEHEGKLLPFVVTKVGEKFRIMSFMGESRRRVTIS